MKALTMRPASVCVAYLAKAQARMIMCGLFQKIDLIYTDIIQRVSFQPDEQLSPICIERHPADCCARSLDG